MPESVTPEERLLKRVIARLRCSHCHRQHAAGNVNVMGKYDSIWIVGVECDGCQRPGMFVVSIRKDSSVERVSDLTDEEQERFMRARSVDAGDVAGIRDFLKGFRGNFTAMFGGDGD